MPSMALDPSPVHLVALDGAVIRPDADSNALFRKSADDKKAAEELQK